MANGVNDSLFADQDRFSHTVGTCWATKRELVRCPRLMVAPDYWESDPRFDREINVDNHRKHSRTAAAMRAEVIRIIGRH